MHLVLSLLLITGAAVLPAAPGPQNLAMLPGAVWLQAQIPNKTHPYFHFPQQQNGFGHSPFARKNSGFKKNLAEESHHCKDNEDCGCSDDNEPSPENPTWVLGLLGLAAAGLAYSLKLKRN